MMFVNHGDIVSYSPVRGGPKTIKRAEVFTVDKKAKTVRLRGYNRDFPISHLTKYIAGVE